MDKQLGNKVLPYTTVLYPSLGHRACALGRDLSLIRIYSMTGHRAGDPKRIGCPFFRVRIMSLLYDLKGIDTTSESCET